jgi:hypothetical protein
METTLRCLSLLAWKRRATLGFRRFSFVVRHALRGCALERQAAERLLQSRVIPHRSRGSAPSLARAPALQR